MIAMRYRRYVEKREANPLGDALGFAKPTDRRGFALVKPQ